MGWATKQGPYFSICFSMLDLYVCRFPQTFQPSIHRANSMSDCGNHRWSSIPFRAPRARHGASDWLSFAMGKSWGVAVVASPMVTISQGTGEWISGLKLPLSGLGQVYISLPSTMQKKKTVAESWWFRILEKELTQICWSNEWCFPCEKNACGLIPPQLPRTLISPRQPWTFEVL